MKYLYVLPVLVCSFLVFKKSSTTPVRGFQYYTFDLRCEPIAIQMCKGLGYNQTYFPNLMKHETQREANREINSFAQLIMANCSSDLRAFLCSLYAPVCTMLKQPIQPCRTLCKRARRGCIKLLKKFRYKWPKKLRCKNFPKPSKDVICVDKKPAGRGKNKGRRVKRKKKGRRKGKQSKKSRKKGKNGKKRGKKGKKIEKQMKGNKNIERKTMKKNVEG